MKDKTLDFEKKLSEAKDDNGENETAPHVADLPPEKLRFEMFVGKPFVEKR